MSVPSIVAPVPFQIQYAEETEALIQKTIKRSYRGYYGKKALDFFLSYHSKENLINDAQDGASFLYFDDQLVGTGSLVNHNVRRVFVDPDKQGRGYGLSIMNHLEQIAARRNLDYVELNASLPATRFYDQLGYENLGFCRFPVANDETLDYYRMAKILKPDIAPPDVNLQAKKFMITGRRKERPAPAKGYICTFSQKQGLFMGIYTSPGITYGEIVGCLQGTRFQAYTEQMNQDGHELTDFSTGRVFVCDDGRLLLQNIINGLDMMEYPDTNS